MDLTKAAADVLAERERQKTVEGWTEEHDDSHRAGQMARAAASYAISGSCDAPEGFRAVLQATTIYGGSRTGFAGSFTPATLVWPWDMDWFKPKSPREDLVRAGALILADIERLDRALAAKEARDHD